MPLCNIGINNIQKRGLFAHKNPLNGDVYESLKTGLKMDRIVNFEFLRGSAVVVEMTIKIGTKGSKNDL